MLVTQKVLLWTLLDYSLYPTECILSIVHSKCNKKILILFILINQRQHCWFNTISVITVLITLHKEMKGLYMWACEYVVLFVRHSPRYPSQWKTTRTPENPENPCCPAPGLTATPPPQSPSPPLPTPQTTRCSGGRACSGHGGWAGREVGAPVGPKGVRAVRQRGSASRDWPCSGARRGKN